MSSLLSSVIERDALQSVVRLLRPASGDAAHQARAKLLLLLLLTPLVALGVVAGLIAFFKGHHSLGTTSEMSWGVLISTYVFLVVSGSGLCLVSSLGHVFGVESLAPLAKRATFLALLLLLIGFAVIATELERPLLLALMAVISPNPAAPIWWMGALYAVYVGVIMVELYFLLVEDHRRSRIAGIVNVVVALAACSNLGAVFGLTHARPYWSGALLPVYFIVTALVCGTALLILVVYLTDYFENDRALRPRNVPVIALLGKLLALFIGAVLFMTVWRMITGVYGAQHHTFDVVKAMLIGPLFVSFWGLELLLGLIIPFAILLSPWRRQPGKLALAAAMSMMGFFFIRYNFVYAGQMFSLKPIVTQAGEVIYYSPAFKGSLSGFLAYTPSIVEIGVVVGALAAAVLGYLAGVRILKVREEA